jgi:hypothetical protein
LWYSGTIIFSLVAGWFLAGLAKAIRQNSVIEPLRYSPPEMFGEVHVTLDQSGATFRTPLSQGHYDWRLLPSCLPTPEYLFLCTGTGTHQYLAIWIPVKALGDQSSLVIASVKSWIRG